MIIENTDLECSEAECVGLDYFLGSHSENKDEWAQRIYLSCKEYAETGGVGYSPEGHPGGMPKVYARSAKDLWEEKKARRRVAFMKDFIGRHPNANESDFMANIIEKTAAGKKIAWSKSHSDDEVKRMRADPRYKTATQRNEEEKARKEAALEANSIKIKAQVAKLLEKGLDAETIAIIFPMGEQYL